MQIGPITVEGEALRELCEKWGIAELALFGSALRDDFGPESDIDLLVTWLPGRKPRLFDMFSLGDELQGLLGRPVDLLQRQVIEADENHYRRRAILDSARSVYAAA